MHVFDMGFRIEKIIIKHCAENILTDKCHNIFELTSQCLELCQTKCLVADIFHMIA